MRVVPVAPVTLPLMWPQVESWIATALKKAKADISIDDVYCCIEEGKMQLWLAHDGELKGCCITEVCESTRGRNCNLVVVAGERFDSWAHLENDVAGWAREKDCKRLTLQGRKGWTRRLDNGWQESAVKMEKEI